MLSPFYYCCFSAGVPNWNERSNKTQYVFFTVWAETGDFRDNSHSSMTSVANSLDISQLHFQPPTNLRNNKNRDRKADGKVFFFQKDFQFYRI